MVRMAKSDHHDPSPHPILIKCSAVGELGSNSKCVELRWPDRAYAPVSPACLPPQIQIDSNTNTTNCRDHISKSLETNQQKNIFNDQHFYKKKCTVNALNMANASNMHHGVATEKQLVLTSLLAVRESWRLPLTLAQPCQTKFHLLCNELVLCLVKLSESLIIVLGVLKPLINTRNKTYWQWSAAEKSMHLFLPTRLDKTPTLNFSSQRENDSRNALLSSW